MTPTVYTLANSWSSKKDEVWLIGAGRHVSRLGAWSIPSHEKVASFRKKILIPKVPLSVKVRWRLCVPSCSSTEYTSSP